MTKNLQANATIIERRDVTESLAIFQLGTDEPLSNGEGKRPFLPGQYVTLGLPSNRAEGPRWIQRPFTIASAPEVPNLEIYLRRVEQPATATPFSHLLFERRPPERLYVRNAATGRFTLGHTIGEDSTLIKLFVAGGTGIAPFLSMIRSRALRTNESLSDYVLIHGVRTPGELAYHDELMRLAVLRGLRYLPTVSRPLLAPTWEGMAGRVTDLLRPDRIERTESILGVPIRPLETIVFVCGLSDLITGAIEQLLHRGYVPAHRKMRALHRIPEGAPTTIFFEQYDDAPLVSREVEVAGHSVA
jgi:ferredoxin-NADP reductase